MSNTSRPASNATPKASAPKIKRLGVFRTARRIMEGYAYVRQSVCK